MELVSVTSSEERREVAERPGEQAQLGNLCPFEAFFVRLNVIIFGDNGWDRTDGDVFGRLADLREDLRRAAWYCERAAKKASR